MVKRQFELSQGEVSELTRAFDNEKDGPTRIRLQAVRLYGTGYAVESILDIAGCSRSSLMGWCRDYRQAGVAALADHRLGGNFAKLKPAQVQELKERLQAYTPQAVFGSDAATLDGQFWTVGDLAQAIERWYGVTYSSRSSFSRLFAVCDFSYQRPAQVFKSRKAAAVAEFEQQVEKN